MFKKILVVLLFSITISYTLGFNIPDYNGYVTDLTNTLSADQIKEISSTIENIKNSTQIEIAILIVPTIDQDNINLLAADIGNKRGVGGKDKNNGIMILFAMEDRERSIQVGYGLEGTIPDAIAKRIGENNIVKNFREGNYFNGIKSTLDELYLYIQKDPTIIQNYSKENPTITNRDNINFEVILFWLVIASIISRSILPKTKRKDKKRRTILSFIILGIGIILGLIISNLVISIIVGYIGMLFGIFGKGGGIVGGFGSGGFGGGSSGGFSGFGGGSFGGGGGGGRR